MKITKIKRGKPVILGIIILIAIISVYLTFFYARKCSDGICFNAALSKCKKAKYIDDAIDAVWAYEIKGKASGECKVEVELVQLKQGATEMEALQKKSMVCYMPLGTISSPQENLARCHGLLKEEMQSLIITRLHNYIVDNLGEIAQELTKPL